MHLLREGRPCEASELHHLSNPLDEVEGHDFGEVVGIGGVSLTPLFKEGFFFHCFHPRPPAWRSPAWARSNSSRRARALDFSGPAFEGFRNP
jgi:hypothetical protein